MAHIPFETNRIIPIQEEEESTSSQPGPQGTEIPSHQLNSAHPSRQHQPYPRKCFYSSFLLLSSLFYSHNKH